ncbi:MAG TPA: glycosyltransferase [Solirubrobacteraceae bacterium]|jgi:glycosyltransferase involved in cell wall biosynthesis|nr:glycosyltransferase [Solirubrobacteraceae bacterium]
MRICLVYDCLFPCTVGGAERWYRNLAERLAKEGHEITYLTLRQWPRAEGPPRVDGVEVVAVGPKLALYTADGRRKILPPLVFGLGVLWHLLRRGRRYEVVHTCSFPYFSLLAAGAARPLGRYGLVVDWHEVWSRSYWRDYLGGVAGAVGYAVQLLCARLPQRAFCFSRLHARRLVAEGLRGQPTVLEGEYAGSLEPPVARPAEPLVVFAGRLIPEKRAPLAVAAFAIAARHIADSAPAEAIEPAPADDAPSRRPRVAEPALRGEFYGDGPERDALARAIAEHGVDAIATAPGFVDAARIDAALGHAMCMLSTSSREGYGMVVIEAAARAAPSVVVAGEDNAAVELVEEGVNGVVAPTADPEAIAAAIVRVHEAGMAMRESTAEWFARNARRLSLESSLRAVLASYERGAGGDSNARE